MTSRRFWTPSPAIATSQIAPMTQAASSIRIRRSSDSRLAHSCRLMLWYVSDWCQSSDVCFNLYSNDSLAHSIRLTTQISPSTIHLWIHKITASTWIWSWHRPNCLQSYVIDFDSDSEWLHDCSTCLFLSFLTLVGYRTALVKRDLLCTAAEFLLGCDGHWSSQGANRFAWH